ncbi:MAG: copper resistance protein CopC [Thermomicrobiales bacterium]|nr:copper resistance protein CopC [Thermomicrobiales bacterium]
MPRIPGATRVISFIHTRLRLTGLLTLLVWVLVPFAGGTADAHAELERSSPAANAVLAAPPQTIDLWMTEPVATVPGSPEMRLLDESGASLPVNDLRVDPNDPRHITADLEGVGFGIFTVVWTASSDTDGHTLSGTYAFRVGGTSRAPGAATVEGETPRAWAVATRWLTFLGAAIAAAGFLIGAFVLGRSAGADQTLVRRMRLIAAASLAGLLATAAEPLLQSQFPPAGLAAPSFGDAFGALPDAWFLRVPGLALAAILAFAYLVKRPADGPARPIAFAGAAGALLAILGLALTSHASARESLRAVAVASVIVHQWSVALWTGGLIQILLARPFERDGERSMPIHRFSRIALVLALAGIATGVVNAGLILPTLRSLWESDYGKVLIVKAIVLVPALILATYHRVALRRALDRVAAAFRLTLRVETALVALVVLGGSTLALLAPPSEATSELSSVDLAAEIPGAPGRYVRFVVSPADTGENELAVTVTEGAPRDFNDAGTLVDAPPSTDVQLVRIGLTSIESNTAPDEIELTPGADGWFRSGATQLGLEGWWRADVLVRLPSLEDTTTSFFFILPDPNIHGEDAMPQPAADEAARAVYETGMNGLLTLNSVHFTERLGGGTGTTLRSDHTVHAGSEGQPAALHIATADSEIIRMEGFQWVKRAGGDWIRTDANQVVPPSKWGTDYDGATGFRLGGQERIGDRTAQIVTFHVPGTWLAPAWYAWWVDVESGRLLRETMVSTGHYMVRDFDSFDAAPPIVPPAE